MAVKEACAKNVQRRQHSDDWRRVGNVYEHTAATANRKPESAGPRIGQPLACPLICPIGPLVLLEAGPGLGRWAKPRSRPPQNRSVVERLGREDEQGPGRAERPGPCCRLKCCCTGGVLRVRRVLRVPPVHALPWRVACTTEGQRDDGRSGSRATPSRCAIRDGPTVVGGASRIVGGMVDQHLPGVVGGIGGDPVGGSRDKPLAQKVTARDRRLAGRTHSEAGTTRTQRHRDDFSEYWGGVETPLPAVTTLATLATVLALALTGNGQAVVAAGVLSAGAVGSVRITLKSRRETMCTSTVSSLSLLSPDTVGGGSYTPAVDRDLHAWAACR